MSSVKAGIWGKRLIHCPARARQAVLGCCTVPGSRAQSPRLTAARAAACPIEAQGGHAESCSYYSTFVRELEDKTTNLKQVWFLSSATHRIICQRVFCCCCGISAL